MKRHHKQGQKQSHAGAKAAAVRQAGLIPVSDHALIRFLEGVGGMDVEAVRLSMQLGLSRAAAIARSMGDGDFVIKLNGHQYVVRNDIVTTVLPGTRQNVLGRAQPAGEP